MTTDISAYLITINITDRTPAGTQAQSVVLVNRRYHNVGQGLGRLFEPTSSSTMDDVMKRITMDWAPKTWEYKDECGFIYTGSYIEVDLVI